MPLRHLPLQRKLVSYNFLTSLAVLLLSSLVLLVYETRTSKQTSVRNLATLGEIIASNSTAALIYDDPALGNELLATLRAEPDVIAAALFDKQGRPFATYNARHGRNEAPAMAGPDGLIFSWEGITLSRPVTQGDARVGTLFIKADLSSMYGRLRIYGAVMLAVLIGAAITGLFLSNLFQRTISRPILDLAATAKSISERKDYAVRANKHSHDELGVLTDAFNSMLDRIESVHSSLADSEARFRLLADNMAQLAWIADEQGNGLWYNKRWYDYTGTTLDEMQHRGWEKVHDPQHVGRVRRHLGECFAAGRIWEDTFPLRGTDGNYRWFLSRAVPMRFHDGRVTRWFGTNTDINDQRTAEAELMLARDKAMAASRAKDDFLAALSHELRTPLNPVLLLAGEAASDRHLEPEIRAHFDMIRKNVELEARLIDDLLDLTRLNREKMVLDLQLVDAHGLIRDSLEMVRADLEAKQIILNLELHRFSPTIRADTVRMQQVLWNIFKNAVKFTPEGGTVTVATEIDSESRMLAIRISDTGIGLVPGEIERIFEPFVQGDHVEERGAHRFGGLGLGLAISRRIIELHQGKITAASAGRNRGSSFTVALPEMKVVLGSPNGVNPSPAVPEYSGLPFSPSSNGSSPRQTILLVEDHAPTRSALETLLKRRHFHVASAGCVAEARELAARGTFDLVISDIGLPDGTGFELMKELKTTYGLKGIALTGYGMENDLRLSKDAGFVSHLVKPVRIQTLDEALTAVFPPEFQRPSSVRPSAE